MHRSIPGDSGVVHQDPDRAEILGDPVHRVRQASKSATSNLYVRMPVRSPKRLGRRIVAGIRRGDGVSRVA